MANIKKKRKFNVVDLVLVLTVAAIVVAVVFVGNKLLGSDEPVASGNDKVIIEYSLQFREIPDSGTGNLAEGDVMRDANSKASMGEVKEIFLEPYTELVYSEVDGQGSGVMAEMEGYTNMLVTVRGEATKDERGYYLNGVKILVGRQMDVWAPGYSGQGWCVAIREVD